MPGSAKKQRADAMPDMTAMLESVLGNMPGMDKLPAEEKKKMKKAIKATTEKVQSMDLEGIFRDAMGEDAPAGSLPPPAPPRKEKPKKPAKKLKKPPKLRTPDKQYQINLSLEELFKGTTNKKLTVRVERRTELTEEDRVRYKEHSGEDAPENSYKYASTKIKHAISDRLEPGMMDDDVIVFEKQADEAEDHITGDIVASIVQDQHSLFERENNDLWILNKKISLAQSYFGGFKFAHLDGRLIEVIPENNEPLHADGGLRRIPNAGMPIRNEDDDEDGIVEDEENAADGKAPTHGDLYIQFELELPEFISDREAMVALFPDAENEVDAVTQELIDSGAQVHKKMIEKVEDPYESGNFDDEDESDDDDDEDESESDGTDETDPETDGSDEEESDQEAPDSEAENAADQAVLELLMEEAKNSGTDMSPEEAAQQLDTLKKGKKSKKH